jgi:hypothetical protein
MGLTGMVLTSIRRNITIKVTFIRTRSNGGLKGPNDGPGLMGNSPIGKCASYTN